MFEKVVNIFHKNYSREKLHEESEKWLKSGAVKLSKVSNKTALLFFALSKLTNYELSLTELKLTIAETLQLKVTETQITDSLLEKLNSAILKIGEEPFLKLYLKNFQNHLDRKIHLIENILLEIE